MSDGLLFARNNRMDQIFRLTDGRNLGYRIHGPTDGWPVLYFHGTPSSRLELQLLGKYGVDIEQVLNAVRIRLIAIDRPGMGLSSFHSNRTFVSFANDAYALTQALGISHCSVMCWSGGGPYALAIACIYPLLIKNVSILCGFSQRFSAKVVRQMGMNKWYFLTARYLPRLLEFTLNKVSRSSSRHSLPQWFSRLPDVDHNLMKGPDQLQTIATTTLKEACRAGTKGPVYDAQLYFEDFGFALRDIRQIVHFWWGTQDTAVHRLHAEAVEREVRASVLHYIDGEGHLSLYVRYFREAIELIAGHE